MLTYIGFFVQNEYDDVIELFRDLDLHDWKVQNIVTPYKNSEGHHDTIMVTVYTTERYEDLENFGFEIH